MGQAVLMKLDSDDRNALLARYKSRLQSGQAALFERYLAEADAPRCLLYTSRCV